MTKNIEKRDHESSTKNDVEKIDLADLTQEEFEQKCYGLYQLEWMMRHGFSLEDLYNVMLKYEKEMFDPMDFRDSDGELNYENEFDESDLERAADQARNILLFEEGFDGKQIFAPFRQNFLDAEYKDTTYMKQLFEMQDEKEKNKLKKLYLKYTGLNLESDCDSKLHTLAGNLKVYRNLDPHYKGFKVTLTPSGLDKEILVAVIENAEGLNVNIVTYADAESDEPTANNILSRESIKAAYMPKIHTKEELKPIIFNEWKKFTLYDGENISADAIDNVPQNLLDEIAFRCDSLETDDITKNIRACLEYAKKHGTRALIKEMDDCNIWRYIA